MKRIWLALPCIALLGACSSLSPQEDPVYLRLNDIEARLMRMERVFENESLIELASDMDALRSDVQELRGQVETLRHDMETQAERQRDLYVDVDSRLQALEEAGATAASAPASGQTAGGSSQASASAPGEGAAGDSAADGSSSSAASTGGGSAQARYDRAFELIQARDYEQAATAFNEFLESFPDSQYAANAQYWLAETYYVRSRFSDALPEFRAVLDNYPRSSKIPDALLKVGYCEYELDNLDAAREALREVQAEYPDTTAARLARNRLDQISRETG